jgi:hypothetical protein
MASIGMIYSHPGEFTISLRLLSWGGGSEARTPVRNSQETHYVSSTKPNRLMLFGETDDVYCENHTKHMTL